MQDNSSNHLANQSFLTKFIPFHWWLIYSVSFILNIIQAKCALHSKQNWQTLDNSILITVAVTSCHACLHFFLITLAFLHAFFSVASHSSSLNSIKLHVNCWQRFITKSLHFCCFLNRFLVMKIKCSGLSLNGVLIVLLVLFTLGSRAFFCLWILSLNFDQR